MLTLESIHDCKLETIDALETSEYPVTIEHFQTIEYLETINPILDGLFSFTLSQVM